MTSYKQQEEKRFAALPSILQAMQAIAYKCWTYLDIYYPWHPDVYEHQVVLLDDGFVQLRLKAVLNKSEIIEGFLLLDTCTACERAHFPTRPLVDAPYAEYIRQALHLSQDGRLQDQVLTPEQLSQVIQYRVDTALAQLNPSDPFVQLSTRAEVIPQ